MLINLVLSLACDLKRQGTCAGKYVILLLCVLIVFSFISAACTREAPAPQKKVEVTLLLSSPAFEEGDRILAKYTCDGQDISPPLLWGEPPQATKVFALVVDDPDAPSGVFTHWILFNLPNNIRQLREGIPAEERLESGALHGKNDFGKIGYSGPCPPRGPAHRYYFTIYALDKFLDLNAGASKKQLFNAMIGHILAQGQLVGIYQR